MRIQNVVVPKVRLSGHEESQGDLGVVNLSQDSQDTEGEKYTKIFRLNSNFNFSSHLNLCLKTLIQKSIGIAGSI